MVLIGFGDHDMARQDQHVGESPERTAESNAAPAVAPSNSMWAGATSGVGAGLLQRKLARRLAMRRASAEAASGDAGTGSEHDAAPARATGPVAKLGLHADTESVDRTKLTMGELRRAQVGHSWISLRYLDPNAVPSSVGAPTSRLLREGGTAMGFWPLIHRVSQWPGGKPSPSIADRLARGETPGAGASSQPAHRGFKLNPLDSWVPGRVEEPDSAHAPKGTQSYDLDQTQVDSLLRYVDSKRNAQYSLYRYNCTTFAVEAVTASGHNAPAASTMGICLPNALYRDILEEKNDGDADATTEPLSPDEHEPAPTSKR